MAVSKIIHQVWEGRTEPCMPSRLQLLARTWKEQNPEWEYHLWNGDEMDELVYKYFPEYLFLYKSFPYNVQRWDTIRYMILYMYGGIYTDLDTECFRSIDTLLEGVTMGFGEEPPINSNKTYIGNAFMVSEEKSPGWLAILEDINLNIVEKENSIQTILDSTGPYMTTRLFDRLKKEYGACYFPYYQVTPVNKYDMCNYIFHGKRDLFHQKIKDAFCAHYFFGSWDDSLSFY